jgi:hypothetical protein
MQVPAVAAELGGTLTVIYSAQSETPQKTPLTLLPLLVVLFVISYAILTLLVVEQGRTIESQRTLLRDLLKDSTQLAALKGKVAREEAARTSGKPVEPQKGIKPGNSESAKPKSSGGDARRPRQSARTTKQAPERPAADLQDVRRSTREI